MLFRLYLQIKKTTILRTSMFIFLHFSQNACKISWKTYIGFCNVCNRSILQRWGRLVICGEIITTFKIRGLVFLTLSIFGEVIPKYLQNMQAQEWNDPDMVSIFNFRLYVTLMRRKLFFIFLIKTLFIIILIADMPLIIYILITNVSLNNA